MYIEGNEEKNKGKVIYSFSVSILNVIKEKINNSRFNLKVSFRPQLWRVFTTHI